MVAALAISASAQSAFAQSKAEIQRMDRNGDGVVTRAEWRENRPADFRLHDTNKDGVLSGIGVWESSQTVTDWNWVRDYDTNNNSMITRAINDALATFRALKSKSGQPDSRTEFRDVAGTSGSNYGRASECLHGGIRTQLG